jgi:hypothetical protein
MLTSKRYHLLPACLTMALATSAMAAGITPVAEVRSQASPSAAVMNPPLENWVAPQFYNAPVGAISSDGSFGAKGTTMAKTARTLATFIPVAPCRLVDTRGSFNPVYGSGGPFAPNEVRVYQAAGNCGIPAGSNRILAVSVAVTTLPTAASGDVEVIANNATLGGTVLMVIQAGLWNSATTATGVDASGNFKVQIRQTSANMALDVNGYYAQMDPSNTGDFYSILGNFDSDGGLLNVNETGAIGAAIRGVNPSSDVRLAQGENAIDVVSGGLRVRGAGVNTDTLAAVHQVSALNLCDGSGGGLDSHYTLLNNPQTFSAVGADLSGMVLFAQQRGDATSVPAVTAKPVSVAYRTGVRCTASFPLVNGWFLYNGATVFATGESYNLMVIKP